jgi:hypothetical protein
VRARERGGSGREGSEQVVSVRDIVRRRTERVANAREQAS